MIHPTLFDVTNHDGNVGFTYRQSDPETSKQAAANVGPKLGERQKEFVAGLVLCGGEATANEAAKAIWLEKGYRNVCEIETIRKRSLECVRLGVVEQLPDDRDRPCNETGSNAHVYRLVK